MFEFTDLILMLSLWHQSKKILKVYDIKCASAFAIEIVTCNAPNINQYSLS